MILLSGYYGFNNLGDEAILSVLCHSLKELGASAADIWVLSGDTNHTRSTHGVEAINRYDILGFERLLKQCDFLLSGGGSLLQDATSLKSIPYYLGVVERAMLSKVKVVGYAQGLGPIKTLMYRRWTASVYRRMHDFTVRDEQSADFLQALGVLVTPDQVSVDPVFSLRAPAGDHSEPDLVINLRPYAGWERDKQAWVRFLQEMEVPVTFLSLGPGDGEIGRLLAQSVSKLAIFEPTDHREALAFLSQRRVGIFMRLHAIILSAVAGCFPVGLCYDPKVEAVGRLLNLPLAGVAPDEYLYSKVVEIYDDPSYRRKLTEQVEMVRKRANLNKLMLKRVIGSEMGG